MGFPRQEYWSGLPFASLGDLADPGIELISETSVLCTGLVDSLPLSHQRSPQNGLGKRNGRNFIDTLIYDNHKKTKHPEKKMPRQEKGLQDSCLLLTSSRNPETSPSQVFVGSFAHSSNSVRG